MKKILFILVAIAFAFASCEGPMGPAGLNGLDGENGIDGDDGNLTCMDCHNTGNIETITAQFGRSGHAGGIVSEEHGDWSSSCVKCHTSQGFIEFARTGINIDAINYNPGGFECKTCHGIHQTFEGADYALNLKNPITFVGATATADLGNSNLCANCHQSRTKEPNMDKPGTSYTMSIRTGPHHAPQGNIVYGYGFAEITGDVSYQTAGTSIHMDADARCTGCHMGESTNVKEGGHTWKPNLSACNSCHTTADFNYGGVQTAVAADLVVLRDLLVAEGALKFYTNDYYELDPVDGVVKLVAAADSYSPVAKSVDMVVAQAVFNYMGIYEDRSLGVHNPKYVKALLANTIKAMQARVPAK